MLKPIYFFTTATSLHRDPVEFCFFLNYFFVYFIVKSSYSIVFSFMCQPRLTRRMHLRYFVTSLCITGDGARIIFATDHLGMLMKKISGG